MPAPLRTSRLALPLLLAALAPAGPAAGQAGNATAGAVGDRLMDDLGVLAADSMGGRAAGSEGAGMARAYLVERLRGIGVAPVLDPFEVRRRTGAVEGVNVVATIPGTAYPDRYVVLSAHYDHLGTREGEVYNGADDNASGTAALLALAEDLVASAPRHSVILLFADAEEGGLQGARDFVADPPVALDRILLNVNLDMVSRSTADLWVSGTHPRPELKPLVDRVTPAPPVVLRFGHDTPEDQGADNWVMASDHAAFHEEGIPFLYFGVADHPDYHRPTDDVGAVDPAFFRAAVETIRRVVRSADESLEGRRIGG